LLSTFDSSELRLDAIEPLLIAAFDSKHKHVVNAIATMWNKTFEHVEVHTYPDTLKEVLLGLRSYVDIVLPGLDLSSFESGGHRQPSFIDTQDDLNVLDQSLDIPVDHDAFQGAESPSRSASPVVNLLPSDIEVHSTPKSSPRSKRNAAALRHNDSQIQFTAIPSSSPNEVIADSQLLTERQKEVRERQRESTLFKDLGSSLEKQSLPKQLPDIHGVVRAATPERDRRF